MKTNKNKSNKICLFFKYKIAILKIEGRDVSITVSQLSNYNHRIKKEVMSTRKTIRDFTLLNKVISDSFIENCLYNIDKYIGRDLKII